MPKKPKAKPKPKPRKLVLEHLETGKGGRMKKRTTAKNGVAKKARRVAIVKALINQEKPAEIAKAIGVSRKTVYEEINRPETQALIKAWLKPYHQEIRELIPDTLKAVKGSLAYCVRTDGVDTLAALRVVRMVGQVLGWAEGKTGADDGNNSPLRRFSGTMEELLVVYRELTASDSQNSPA